jgi:hypothetical protein
VFAEPAVQFPLAVAQRESGLPRMAERFYMNFSRARPHDAWWSCAAGEQWLVDPKSEPPKSICRVARCETRPRLDSRLDDAIWEKAQPVELRSLHRDDAEWPAAAQLAYDNEFLYLAVDCRRAPGSRDAPTKAPRPRDPDLSTHDRVELCLDLDRDWGTYYKLVVDHRGWVAEQCWGDKSWNPEWFVAARQADGSWTAEAAIPLVELAAERPQSRAVWAAGLQRVVPGVGFQSWTSPASTAVIPEGFGYLIFE